MSSTGKPDTRSELPEVEVYSDGSVRNNPGGPGGYAAILMAGGRKKLVSGFEPDTTNNRMELRGAIAGLSALSKPCSVRMVTDSQYLMFGITKWIRGWKANSWRNTQGGQVANRDLWMILDRLCKYHSVKWLWVRGHTGNELNEEVDVAAAEALETGLEEFKKGKG